jgi:Flp pilus assembly protein TadG
MLAFARYRKRDLRGEGGAAALELALVAPLLMILVVGAAEIGTTVYEGMEAQNAAEAGALYASKHGFDAAGIASAVSNSTANAGLSATPAPTQFCGCPVSGGITEISCTSLCAGGTAPGQYVRVNARITHQPLVSFTGLTVPVTVSGEAIIRLY